MSYFKKFLEICDKIMVFAVVPFAIVCIAMDWSNVNTSESIFDRVIVVWIMIFYLFSEILKMYSNHLQKKKIDKSKQ